MNTIADLLLSNIRSVISSDNFDCGQVTLWFEFISVFTRVEADLVSRHFCQILCHTRGRKTNIYDLKNICFGLLSTKLFENKTAKDEQIICAAERFIKMYFLAESSAKN